MTLYDSVMKVKIKVKFTLERARKAQSGRRHIVLLFLGIIIRSDLSWPIR
jgi:hypothetical protein